MSRASIVDSAALMAAICDAVYFFLRRVVSEVSYFGYWVLAASLRSFRSSAFIDG